jgi:hypothetical protein
MPKNKKLPADDQSSSEKFEKLLAAHRPKRNDDLEYDAEMAEFLGEPYPNTDLHAHPQKRNKETSEPRNDQSRTDKVGYGNPPTSGQFKKGQSGNPKGRPKKRTTVESEREMRAVFMEAANTLVTTTVGGKKTRIPALQALFYKIISRALEGHGPSVRIVLDLAQKFMADHEEWQAIFFEHALVQEAEFQRQPNGEKSPQTEELVELAMEKVGKKITDRN